MDATQKRKTWKIAIVHFSLTISVLLFANFVLRDPLAICLLLILQPQLLMVSIVEFFVPMGLEDTVVFWSFVISMPVWSFGFGWLYSKSVNWLNNFPKLGRKVF